MKSAGALPFPLQLYDMLEDAERNGFDHIINWIPNGAGFKVHMPGDLVKKILPRYLNHQTKYKSFQRQLNMYEFKMLKKVPKGSNKEMYKGAIVHPMFIRGKREVCERILRKSLLAHINNILSTSEKRAAATSKSAPCATVWGINEKEDHKKFSQSKYQQLSYSDIHKENGSISSSNTSAVDQVGEKASSLVSLSTTASSSQHRVAESCMKVSVTNSYDESFATTNNRSAPTHNRGIKTMSSSISTKNCEEKETEMIVSVPTTSTSIPDVAAIPRSITLSKNAFGTGTLDQGLLTACSNTTMQQKQTYDHGIDPSYPTTILKFPLSNHDSVPFNNIQQGAVPWDHPSANRHYTQRMETQQEPYYDYSDSTIFLTAPSQTKIYPEKYQQNGSTSSASTDGDSKHISSALGVVSSLRPQQSISSLTSTAVVASSSSSPSSSYASSSLTLNSSYSDFYFSKSGLNHSHEKQEGENGRLLEGGGFASNKTPYIGTTTAVITETGFENHKDYVDEDPTTWEELFILGYDYSFYDDIVPYDSIHPPIEDDERHSYENRFSF